MPTYMYRCESCGNELQKRQRMTDDPLVSCPNCGEDQLRRVINSVGVVFKGGGFYVTDNRGSSSNGAATSTTSDSSSSSSSDNSSTATKKTESKPASKKAEASKTS